MEFASTTIIAALLLLSCSTVSAQENAPTNNSQTATTERGAGARKARNPLADKISFAIDNAFSFNSGPLSGTGYELDASVLAPTRLGDNWFLLHRATLPFLRDPENIPGEGSQFGLGDITYEAVFTRDRDSKVLWGVGPAFVIPTATSSRLGSGKWSAGPAASVVSQPGHWTLGVIAFNTWSFAGDSAREAVNQFTLEPFVSCDLKAGWFLSWQPQISADWRAPRGERWTAPMGGGGGKGLTSDGKNTFVTVFAYYNVKRPPGSSPWQLSIGLEFQFEK